MTAMPASRAAAGLCSTTGRPSMSSSPSSGWYTPASIFTTVDLPAPFSPSSAWASPAYRSAEPSTTARTAPNDLVACRSDRTGTAGAGDPGPDELSEAGDPGPDGLSRAGDPGPDGVSQAEASPAADTQPSSRRHRRCWPLPPRATSVRCNVSKL